MDGQSLSIGLDWGTSHIRVAWTIDKDGKRNGPVYPLWFDGSRYEIPAKVAWLDNRIVHGDELDKRARDDLQASDRTIVHFKLALYEDKAAVKAADRIDEQLKEIPGAPTYEIFLGDYFRAVFVDIRNALRKSQLRKNFNADSIEQLLRGMQVVVAVPQIWSATARREMQAALKDAGLTAKLAFEPHCVMCCLIEQDKEGQLSLEPNLAKGARSLVVDAGCGTTDMVLYHLAEDLSTRSRLEPVRYARGGTIGSWFVDELIYQSIYHAQCENSKHCKSGQCDGAKLVAEAAREIGITPRDFESRVLAAIEKKKKDFDAEPDEEYPIHVKGAGSNYKYIIISRRSVQTALDKVIEGILEAVDKLLRGKLPDVIELEGGFSSSEYFQQKFRDRYEPSNVLVVRSVPPDSKAYFPVAMGALYRHRDTEPAALPQYRYAILQRQLWDEDLHGDELATKSPTDGKTHVVEDRIINLGRPGEIFEQSRSVSMVFDVLLDHPVISAKLVYLEKHFDNGARSRKKNRKRSVEGEGFLKGVNPWAEIQVPVSKDDLKKAGYELVHNGYAEVWTVDAHVNILPEGCDLRISFDILKPNSKEVAFTVVDATLWEASHNEFV